VLFPIPFEGEPQAFFKRKTRRMSQFRHGPGGVGLRIAHISGPGRAVNRGDAYTLDLLESVPRLVQGDSSSISAVVHFSSDARGFRGLQVQFSYILDECEIARLPTVTEDGGRAALDQALQELQADVLSLGSMVEKAIQRSVEALRTRDALLARRVIDDDTQIDALRYQTEERALLALPRSSR